MSLPHAKRKNNISGFTLIELLVVIALLEILAAGVIIFIDPLEKLAQTRDSVRKSGIAQLSKSLQSYYVNHFSYPPDSYQYMNALVNDGDLKNILPKVPNTSVCLGGVYIQNSYCYKVINSNVYVMIPLEAKIEENKCSNGNPYYMWDSKRSKIGVVCVVPPSWSLGSYTFYP